MQQAQHNTTRASASFSPTGDRAVWPLSTEDQIGLHTIHSRQSACSTQKFLTEQFEARIQSKRVVDSIGCASRNARAKKFSNPPHRSSHNSTYAQTAIPGTTQQYHYTAPTLAWLLLLPLIAESQRGTFLAPSDSSVYHTMAVSHGIDYISPTTDTCCSFGGSRLSETPRR